MVKVKLFVEGGGDARPLKTECRKGFRIFLEKAGLKKSLPAIIACGGRRNAYDSYCTAINNGEPALLLVDSESPVEERFQQGNDAEKWKPWGHLALRKGDQWKKPVNAKDTDCHLMVECMESWFLADRQALCSVFKQGFNSKALPSEQRPIETIPKTDIYRALAKATKSRKANSIYSKGSHSFKVLENTDPNIVLEASPWAHRFITQAKKKMGKLSHL